MEGKQVTTEEYISAKMKELRKSHGWSQTILAEKASMPSSIIGSVERKEKKVFVQSLIQIAQAFNISVSELIGDPMTATSTSLSQSDATPFVEELNNGSINDDDNDDVVTNDNTIDALNRDLASLSRKDQIRVLTLVASLKKQAQKNWKKDDIFEAIAEGDVDRVANCLAQGVNINMFNRNGVTPLNVAVYYYPNMDIIKLLLRAGADVNKPDGQKQLPINLAIRSNDERIVKLFIEQGASTSQVDWSGKPPIFYAVNKGNEKVIALIEQSIEGQ